MSDSYTIKRGVDEHTGEALTNDKIFNKVVWDCFPDFDELTKIHFWVPVELKLEFLNKCYEYGLPMQHLLSGLLFLMLEDNEDLNKALQDIDKVCLERMGFKRRKLKYEDTSPIISRAKKKETKEKGSYFQPMSEKEIEELYEVTEQKLEQHFYKKKNK